MISFELLRIIRNPKCKYGLLIALGTFAFHSQMQQFLTSQYSSISFTMLVVFLFLLLFYQIAWEEEQPHCWKSILAYPKSYRRNYIGKLLALLLFQIPVAGIGILFYYSLESTVSIAFYVIYYAFNVYISLVFSIPVLRHQKVIFLPWGQLLFLISQNE